MASQEINDRKRLESGAALQVFHKARQETKQASRPATARDGIPPNHRRDFRLERTSLGPFDTAVPVLHGTGEAQAMATSNGTGVDFGGYHWRQQLGAKVVFAFS